MIIFNVRVFVSQMGWRLGALFAMLLLAGLAEGLGVSMILPLLQSNIEESDDVLSRLITGLFDLLGHVYRMPSAGVSAEVLTQSSGVATNYHPQYSPDRSRIVFVSDRAGQSNPWVMNADGTDPRPIFLDLDTRVVEPTWTPDGQAVVLR